MESIKNSVSKAVNAVKNVATNVVNEIKSTVSTVTSAVKNTVSTIKNAFAPKPSAPTHRYTSPPTPAWNAGQTQTNIFHGAAQTPAQNPAYTVKTIGGKPTLVPAHFDNPTAAATSFVKERGCDSSKAKAAKQSGESWLQQLAAGAKVTGLVVIKLSGIDRVIAFSQGALSAAVEDWTAPARNLNDAISGTDTAIGKLSPFLENQNEMALGRIVGHLASTATGIVGMLGSFSLMAGGGGGGLVAAPATGGASVAISAAFVTAGAIAAGYTAEVAISSVAALFSDPNIQFSVGNKGDAEQKMNPTKGESKIWKELDNVKGQDRKASDSGSNKKYYEWDHTHNDIEVYDRKGHHLGSMNPTTGEMYKPAVPGRTIKIN